MSFDTILMNIALVCIIVMGILLGLCLLAVVVFSIHYLVDGVNNLVAFIARRSRKPQAAFCQMMAWSYEEQPGESHLDMLERHSLSAQATSRDMRQCGLNTTEHQAVLEDIWMCRSTARSQHILRLFS